MKLRSTITALAVAAGALAAAAPASAEPTWITVARAQNLGNPVSTLTMRVALECSATLAEGSGTYLAECYLKDRATGEHHAIEDDSGALPGPTDANAGIIEVPAAQYDVCIRATALSRNSVFWHTDRCYDGGSL